MNNKYIDLINQTFDFPQEGFQLKDGQLWFYEVPLKDIIGEYGTPLRITYLPKISAQIQQAKQWFAGAIEKCNYQGQYHYAYCTKASHFSFVLEEALRNDIHIETSSAFDIDLVDRLYANGQLDEEAFVICNGYKSEQYKANITRLVNQGRNIIPVLDNMPELDYYAQYATKKVNLGIRIAADEQPNFEFYTSRLGVRYADILDFVQHQIMPNDQFDLRMMHFFINTGIEDTIYYWNELHKAIRKYCEVKKVCPTLQYINIGGGLPIKNSLAFDYDYEYMITEIVNQIAEGCREHGVDMPDIFSEFGSYTVGESGAHLFSIMEQKQQNDKEAWYMIDGSLMTTMPDIWGMSQRFVLLPVNKWDNEYQRVNIGGQSCDKYDYYNAEAHMNQVFLPTTKGEEPLYIGFFNTGAYQESLSGYGGTKHCLIPAPRHVLIQKYADGTLTSRIFRDKQEPEQMLEVLGY